MLTQSEENYLKTIFKITERDRKTASTNDIAEILKTSAASVTDMLKKLSSKELVAYEKYKGASLSPTGNKFATDLVRKHRLWESFLVDKLGFSWEEVHDIAEQMEHIKSNELIDRLDQYLGHPKFDPHGDAIPNAQGKFTIRNQYILDVLDESEVGVLVGVRNNAQDFLEYLNDLNISLGTEFKVLQKIKFDRSVKVQTSNGDTLVFPKKVSSQLFVKKIK